MALFDFHNFFFHKLGESAANGFQFQAKVAANFFACHAQNKLGLRKAAGMQTLHQVEQKCRQTFFGTHATQEQHDAIFTHDFSTHDSVYMALQGADFARQLFNAIEGHHADFCVFQSHGVAGMVFVDDAISSGIAEGVAENPQFKLVGSVHGDWAQDVAQKAVAGILPSLPEDIVAVVTQGGDGYGAAQAFAAAGRPMPTIIMGNREDELKWWKEQKDASGYKTMSVSIAPGVSTLAFWVAQQILDGKEVPKDISVPFLRIDQDNLEANLATTQAGGVANVEYSQADAIAVIEGAM